MIQNFICKNNEVIQNVSRQDLAKALWDKEALVWVDMEEPTEFESETLIELFKFHPLAIEDCLIDHSEPKIDDYDDYLFLVMHALAMDAKNEVKANELELFISNNYLVTFHKAPIFAISDVKNLIERKGGAPLIQGIDMLAHAILDRLVDRYLPILIEHDRRIDEIEDKIFDGEGEEMLQKILEAQKAILHLKRVIGPQRETMNQLSRNVSAFVREDKLIYFRDIYDHLFKYYQMAEELQGMVNNILHIYFSFLSHKLNQAIKTMTILATIALPPVVIASIYGMNFEFMPELRWPHGYWIALMFMFLISFCLLLWIKIKKWL